MTALTHTTLAAGPPPAASPVGRLATAGTPAVPVVNLPNALTVGRLLAVPALAVLLAAGSTPGLRYAALALYTLACLTDVVDGHLARSRGLVTAFGTFADPVADKALVGTALVALALAGEAPWWAVAVVLGREVAVTLMRLAVVRHGVIPANRGGKAKCLTQNVAVTLLLLPLAAVEPLELPVLLLAVAATVATGLDYAAQAVRLRSSAAR